MKIRQFTTMALAALGLLGSQAAIAQTPLSYTNGDLFLGFRASGNTGAAQDYLVNIGQAATFTGATGTLTVSGLGAIGLDLESVYGTDWNTRGDVFWSVSGTPGSFAAVGSDPAKTLYATKVRSNPATPNDAASRWLRGSSTAQGAPTSKMNSLATAYSISPTNGSANNSTVNSPKGYIQSTTDANSYASFQPGGTGPNSGPAPGISYAYFNPSIEGNFGSGTAGSVLDLYRMVAGSSGTPGDYVGSFQLDNSGNLTFTPAPVANVAVIALSAGQASLSESAGPLTVTINRSGDTTSAVSVSLNTADGVAVAGTDYTSQIGTTVSFLAGETQKTVQVAVANRTGVQGNRTFSVSISNPSAGAQLGSTATQTVTIQEADSAVAIENATYSVAENAATLTVKVLRTGNLANVSTVTVTTAGVSAVSGTDFTGLTGTVLSFAATETSKSVDIAIANRSGAQGSRTFTVGLSAPSAGTVVGAVSSATVTITDVIVLAPGSIEFASATFQGIEGQLNDTLLTITVNRIDGSSGAASVQVATAGGTATAGTDFAGVPVTLSWADGESGPKTFNLVLKSDAISEINETVTLGLSNATGGVSFGTLSNSTVTIVSSGIVNAKLVSPAAGAKVSSAGTVLVSGSATATHAVSRVEVRLNGVLVGSPVPDSLTKWSVSVSPEQGLNTLSIKAVDEFGFESAPVSRTFTFTHLRPELAGSYNGLVTAVGNGAAFDSNGLINITVAKTGSFTGKVQLKKFIVPIKGVVLNSGQVLFSNKQSTLTMLGGGLPIGTLTLNVDLTGAKITGSISNANSVVFAQVLGADHAYYTAKVAPVLPLRNVPAAVLDPLTEKGKYTGLFQANAAPNNGVVKSAFPQGTGYGRISVSAAGVVSIIGKLADGTTISYRNALSLNNEWPVFIPLYGRLGFITGKVAFDKTKPQTDATALMTWVKPAATLATVLYPAGWPQGISSDFVASRFVAPKLPTASVPAPPNPNTVLGSEVPGAPNTTTANLAVTVGDGGLTLLSNDASMDARSKVTLIAAADPQTGFTVKLPKATFVASTGDLSGTFVHPVSGKTLAFKGLAYQKTKMASGYFLYVPAANVPAGVKESGSVDIAAK